MKTLHPPLTSSLARNFVWSGVIALITIALVTTGRADTVTYTGTTAGGPTWNRPIEGNPPTVLSIVGTAVPYSVQQFSVSLAGLYNFQSTATNPPNWDNYTFLYQNSFNPMSQFTNVLIGDDDNPSIGLSGFSFNLVAGTNYLFVTTGFSNTSFGAFSNTFAGPGTISFGSANAVPESIPALPMFGLVVVGLAFARARMTAKNA